MVKLLLGLVKGLIIGGAIGYGAFQVGIWNWVVYGLVGAFVGLLVGKPIWSMIRDKESTTVVALLKSAFGFGVGCGLYALVAKVWNPTLEIAAVPGGNALAWPPILGGAIGAVYGSFIELDDSIGDDSSSKKKQLPEAADKSAPVKKQLPPKK